MIQILAGAFLISFSSVFVKLAHVGPTTAMFYRFLFGGVALLLAAFINKELMWKGRRPFLYALLGGVIFSTDLFFWHRSIHYIGPGLSTILANFQVFSLAAIGVVFMGERISWKLSVAVPMAFLGIVLIVGWDVNTLGHLDRMGILFGLLTAACYTGLTLTLQKSQKIENNLSPIANMAWVCIFGAIFGSFEVLPSGESFIVPDMQSFVSLLAYGVICSGAGWVLISRGLPNVPASMAGLALVMQPAMAFVWDVLFFARPASSLHIIGAVITLGAIYLGAVSRND